jgi:hypothetical protein
MRVQFSFTGLVERPATKWADLDAVPREGETVTFPDVPADASTGRTVVWYPMGTVGDPEFSEDEADPTPFVYIVLGPHRP